MAIGASTAFTGFRFCLSLLVRIIVILFRGGQMISLFVLHFDDELKPLTRPVIFRSQE